MDISARWFWALVVQVAAALLTDHVCEDILDTDVVILGGGASGCYAAVRLRDMNASIVLVEQADHLGGHVNVWTEPQTGTPVNYGVQTYWDWGPAKPFFARMGVDVAPSYFPSLHPLYVDQVTGAPMPSYKPPNEHLTQKALARYLELAEMYSDFLVPGYWDLPQGDYIPTDLLLPFGDFCAKYGLDVLVPLITKFALAGVGGIRNTPTFEIMGLAFGMIPARGISDNSSFGPASRDNSELYRKVYEQLADHVYLNSTIVGAERDVFGVKLILHEANGKKRCVNALRLLITATPDALTLPDIGLDDKEQKALTGWTPRSLFVGVIQTFAIPDNRLIYTISTKATTARPMDYQEGANFSLSVSAKEPRGHGIFRVMLESKHPIGVEEAKHLATHNIQKILQENPFPELGHVSNHVKWLRWDPHYSVLMRRSSEEIKAGFVKNMYKLQGYRSTWWTGSLWSSDFSSCVWAFTESVIARMMGLNKTDLYLV